MVNKNIFVGYGLKAQFVNLIYQELTSHCACPYVMRRRMQRKKKKRGPRL